MKCRSYRHLITNSIDSHNFTINSRSYTPTLIRNKLPSLTSDTYQVKVYNTTKGGDVTGIQTEKIIIWVYKNKRKGKNENTGIQNKRKRENEWVYKTRGRRMRVQI
jgi:hypothetical protein